MSVSPAFQRRLAFHLALALAAGASAGSAASPIEATGSTPQEIAPQPFEYPYPVEVYDLPRSANGIEYRLYVRPPLEDPAEGEPPSTVYFLDALRNFTPAAAMSYNWEYFNYIPSSYFVGIGYRNEADGISRESNRTRDYTPTAFEPPDESHFLASHPVDWQGSGGAPAFFDVVEKEIVPFIEKRFAVSADDRVLVGKSTSGLAATYALLTRPELFNRYVIVSPAIWWDDWLDERRDRAIGEAERATRHLSRRREVRAYFAVGEAEERLRLVTDLYVLVDSLRNRHDPNLKVRLEVLPGEQHEGVFPAAFMRGIVAVYAQEPARRSSSVPVAW
jgi:predicted alpha/beta superfamily hydrolase